LGRKKEKIFLGDVNKKKGAHILRRAVAECPLPK